MKARIAVVHGPNLNLLGTREPQVYGSTTLAQIDEGLRRLGEELGVQVDCFQSNHEGALVERIHAAARDGTRFVLINPAAYTHTSVALRDALAGVSLPFVEVHLSNVYRREKFRHHSYFSDLAEAVISGCGALGYSLALRFAVERLMTKPAD
ncbi:MAG: type II 3-dehydroquinate dehydratase [Betaproteobacteria bacterium]|nr:type II 3-dehydroquinate dehydratase [Betaproteobacteria bacterium]MBU6510707.1 type II 3-dehydroquinate dehydratase [Betaproteobacteria bacterium]MDE1955671.1 type II 3-dehydroquinate dehydratase [Betaproteobacteria bacterium]MDE2151709.1 type II 3-dehydroquinate dehydratase [Betaproteobacteria bacterium]MDE2480219.1 type II 3-dehydroquinate dehydratase [Betaproteobacteria bacterium]